MKTFGTLALILVVAAGIGWNLAGPQDACAIDLDCQNTVRRTGAYWGMGASCTEADNEAIALASASIGCDTCTEVPEEVTACYFDTPSGEYHSDWRIAYTCLEFSP